MGAVECIVLALEEECDDPVDVIGGGQGFEKNGGLIMLAS
jgi:hypothetical protein